ncbi:MAG: hypothetical protein DDG60_17050 [Anaerolineae bacterium]|nr:MAG: hypothetical protein DDG60_17050 [Anaerolineae bacterium]
MDTNNRTFSSEEQAALRERAKELKAEARMSRDRAAGEAAVLEKIAEMPEPERSIAMHLHELIQTHAPHLMPKTWYGMPAYANREGKVVCFFQSAQKFGSRYATLGFTDSASLDEGAMWATAFALKKLTPEVEQAIIALVKKATQANA